MGAINQGFADTEIVYPSFLTGPLLKFIRRLFGYSKRESVKAVLLGLGRRNVRYLIVQRKVKFYKSLYLSSNSLLCNIFCMRLMLNSDSDTLLETCSIR